MAQQVVENTERKHSWMGIASFITSIAVGLVIFILIVIAGVMEVSTPGGIDEESIGSMLLGLAIIAMVFLDLAALGLGVAGLVPKGRKKVFAILGTSFSSVTLIVIISLIIVGNSI